MAPTIAVVDPKQMPGPPGARNVLASPIDFDGAPRTVGPFAIVGHAVMPETPPGVLPVDADVRPHPHIGLVAISYVLDGSVTHRDSLGNRSELRAGDIGVTISGRGAAHSERFERWRLLGGRLELFQLLLAMPDGHEDGEPSFFHRTAAELGTVSSDGARVTWLFPAPPALPSGMPWTTPILLADVALESNAKWSPPDAPARALYVREGELAIDDARVRAGQVAVIEPGDVSIRALAPARVLAFGGAMVGRRYYWWNFIHSSLERIEAAKKEWREGRWKLPTGDTESFTPCPPDDGRPLKILNETWEVVTK
jgi:redox-sensitive bicupin YhaK (pirin superfamily)